MLLSSTRRDWLGNIRGDFLAGIVVALALIPEAIAFSIIAGVDPKVGLYASFCIAVVTAVMGGRPGMISAATGRDGVANGDLGERARSAIFAGRDSIDGGFSVSRGLFETRRAHALCITLRGHWFRKCFGHSYFFSADTRAY